MGVAFGRCSMLDVRHPPRSLLHLNQRAPPSEAIFTPTLTRRLFGLAEVAFGAGASVEVLESKKSAHA